MSRFFIFFSLLFAASAQAAPAASPRYSTEARDRVVAAMIATAKQLKPIPQPQGRDREDTNFGGKEDAFERRVFARRNFLVAIAQLGENEAAWAAAKQLKLDTLEAGHFHGSSLPVTFAHEAARHWIAAGDVPRALQLAEFIGRSEFVAQQWNLGRSIRQYQADIWLSAANRLLSLQQRDAALPLLQQAAPIVRRPYDVDVRGFYAWLLQRAGDTAGSVAEFEEARRGFFAAIRDEGAGARVPNYFYPDEMGAWLAVWHLRAGLVEEAGEVAKQAPAFWLPYYLSGELLHAGEHAELGPADTAITAPYARTLLDAAEAALGRGDKAAARRLVEGADAFTWLVGPTASDAGDNDLPAQAPLLQRSAAIYDALGDTEQAARRRGALKAMESQLLPPDTTPEALAKLQPIARLQLWATILQHDAAWGKRHPELIQRATTEIVKWAKQSATAQGGYPSSLVAGGLFRHGFDAEARQIARVALLRGTSGPVLYLELADTFATAKILLDHSAPGSEDGRTVKQFIDTMIGHATRKEFDFAVAGAFAQAGLLDTAVEALKLNSGQAAAVASIWAQQRGALPTLAWVETITDPTDRAFALAAIAAVLADRRDKELPKPLFHWIDNRTMEIERVPAYYRRS